MWSTCYYSLSVNKLESFYCHNWLRSNNVLCTHRTLLRDISLTDQGQSAAATYETVSATYEEIPASREVKGDYSFTQNSAYSTVVSGRDAPAAEGIYDN